MQSNFRIDWKFGNKLVLCLSTELDVIKNSRLGSQHQHLMDRVLYENWGLIASMASNQCVRTNIVLKIYYFGGYSSVILTMSTNKTLKISAFRLQ